MGERTPVAAIDAAAASTHGDRRVDHQPAGRAGRRYHRVKLSANWMAACGEAGEDAALFHAVRAASRVLPGGRGQRAGRQGFACRCGPAGTSAAPRVKWSARCR